MNDEYDNLEEDDEEWSEDDLVTLPLHTIDMLRKGEFNEEWDDETLLIARFIDGMKMREMGDASVKDITRLINWYNRVIVGNELIEMILSGDIHITFNDDDKDGIDPVFSLTLQGKEKANESKKKDKEDINGWN